MTKWFHKCDLDWLKARQQHLTATDIKELLPITKTGRKRKVDDENYLKVFANKIVNLDEFDCVSTGAAARGHILEPYAIELFNECGFKDKLYHWDDVIVTRMDPCQYDLAFSPDAMNIPPDTNETVVFAAPTIIGEVKSYSPERHLVCGHTPKDQLEERWQIAAAMSVCGSIGKAYLLFYNPLMKDSLYIVDYYRDDLKAEIDIIANIEAEWFIWLDNLKDQIDCHDAFSTSKNEQVIISEIMKREELNPEGEKSVIQ